MPSEEEDFDVARKKYDEYKVRYSSVRCNLGRIFTPPPPLISDIPFTYAWGFAACLSATGAPTHASKTLENHLVQKLSEAKPGSFWTFLNPKSRRPVNPQGSL